MQNKLRIAGLVTCYNRVGRTLKCLEGVFAEAAAQKLATLEIFLIDDASPDGTGKIVKARFPQVQVAIGTGKLFWNRGMCAAYAFARSHGRFDAYILFNDDVELVPGGFMQLLEAYIALNQKTPAVITGPMCSKFTGEMTYGGINIIAKYRPLSFAKVALTGQLQLCDTFNTNFTIVPGTEMDAVGGLDPAYHHHYGDVDLGLVLGKRGCKSYLLGEPIGYCELNSPPPIPPLLMRIKALWSLPSPVSDRVHFTFKRYPWPLAAVLASIQVIKRVFEAFQAREGSWEY